jgi:hypothetical protein
VQLWIPAGFTFPVLAFFSHNASKAAPKHLRTQWFLPAGCFTGGGGSDDRRPAAPSGGAPGGGSWRRGAARPNARQVLGHREGGILTAVLWPGSWRRRVFSTLNRIGVADETGEGNCSEGLFTKLDSGGGRACMIPGPEQPSSRTCHHLVQPRE